MVLFSRAFMPAVLTLMLAGSASAQTTAPAATPTSKITAATKTPVAHSAVSVECSKEADAKGLHGKERKKFRAECKKTGAKAQ